MFDVAGKVSWSARDIKAGAICCGCGRDKFHIVLLWSELHRAYCEHCGQHWEAPEPEPKQDPGSYETLGIRRGKQSDVV